MVSGMLDPERFSCEAFRREAANLLALIRPRPDVRSARALLFDRVSRYQFEASLETSRLGPREEIIVRDCARAFRSLLRKRAEARGGFSVMGALWDLAHDVSRSDLGPGFYAELIHLVQGMDGRAPYHAPGDFELSEGLGGRQAACVRSRELDRVWERAVQWMARYPDGLDEQARARRAARRQRILDLLGGTEAQWHDYRWHLRHVVKDPELLGRLVPLSEEELANVRRARAAHVPFGITPYYLSLLDEDPAAGRDRALRAQVLPPADYLAEMAAHHGERERAFDFMLENQTSPVDLVTRRYPAIAIFKPYNSCPQICVYCQRNWEIDDALCPHALASEERLEAACRWLGNHPAVTEVLVTGGDPLTLPDAKLGRILERIATIPHVDLIRVGSRIPVTLPMRITPRLARLLGRLRQPGRREVCLVTHVEHCYEVTPEFVAAVDRLRRQGIAVYNQLVYTFYVSRRFECARLRLLLRRVGVDPYYTFVPKGKQETRSYRVPLARILQEQEEEARLLPGLRRTDEVVYNVPGLGKNYLRAAGHRDLVSIHPDGARVYEFHPWEKAACRDSWIGKDVPILDYLGRLQALGENPEDYASIWYYF